MQAILPFFGLLVALLMVSRIRYPHVTNRVLRGQRSFGHVVAVVFFFVAIMVVRGYAVPIVGLRVRALRADPPGLGEMGPAAPPGRAVVLRDGSRWSQLIAKRRLD